MLHNDQKLFLLVFLLYLTVKISAVTLTPLFPYSNYQSSIECVNICCQLWNPHNPVCCRRRIKSVWKKMGIFLFFRSLLYPDTNNTNVIHIKELSSNCIYSYEKHLTSILNSILNSHHAQPVIQIIIVSILLQTCKRKIIFISGLSCNYWPPTSELIVIYIYTILDIRTTIIRTRMS